MTETAAGAATSGILDGGARVQEKHIGRLSKRHFEIKCYESLLEMISRE